jgi:hypothetical protein
MTENPTHTNTSPSPGLHWPGSEPRKKEPSSPRQPKKLGRPTGSKNMTRRDYLLRRLNVDVEFLASQPQISPLLKKSGILPDEVIAVLRADESPESRKLAALYHSLTPANRNILGLEALSVAAGLTPRRLWELYNGASLEQGRAILIARKDGR